MALATMHGPHLERMGAAVADVHDTISPDHLPKSCGSASSSMIYP